MASMLILLVLISAIGTICISACIHALVAVTKQYPFAPIILVLIVLALFINGR